MRMLRILLVVLFAVVVLLAVVTYILPRETSVERSVTISASPEEIFPYLNSMQATEAWSPWMGLDPDMVLMYEGPETGVGNRLVWRSEHPQVGSGTQEIVVSVANSRVETVLDFGPMGTAGAWFDLEPEAGETILTWGFTTDAGMNPVARWMGLMMDRWVGADYERGLTGIKALVEGS